MAIILGKTRVAHPAQCLRSRLIDITVLYADAVAAMRYAEPVACAALRLALERGIDPEQPYRTVYLEAQQAIHFLQSQLHMDAKEKEEEIE